MCDKETKFNFRWSHVSEGVMIVLLLGIVYGFWDIRKFVDWSIQFHADIPTDFFVGLRWDFVSEMKEQAETNQQIGTLDKRMSLIEAQHIHAMESLRRIEDAVTKP